MKLSTSLLLLVVASGLATASKPNILFILTDDQDVHMGSSSYMPFLQTDIISKGTTYNRHFCTVALCCPSRASMWTGKAAHNTNVTDVSPPYGGYAKIVAQGINDDYLPLWMQAAGYNTYYSGKLWNFHSIDNYDDPYVRGYNASDFLLDPNTYRYYDAVMTHNGEPPKSFAGKYSPDVVAEFAYKQLEDAMSHAEPWFLTVAPIAPHSNAVFDETTNVSYLAAPVAAPRHEHLFHDYKIPRGKSFNKAIEGGASWVGRLPELNQSVIEYNDHYQRQRLRALQSVDEMIHRLVKRVDAAGQLENTYIIYTTDNGYHISQHRMNPGKECGYDTDIHIPLYIRGPGVAEDSEMDIVTTHTDIAPTLLKIAGVPKTLDGEPIPLAKKEEADFKTEHVGIEYWGYGIPEGQYGYRSDRNFEAGKKLNIYTNNTYKGIRMIGENYSLYYSVWCTGEKELFDLKADPEQTVNLLQKNRLASKFNISGRDASAVVDRLDALMMVLKDCKGIDCTRPWRVLHPDDKIFTLEGALREHFDNFYDKQPKMAFHSCQLGFLAEEETHEHVDPYTESGRLRKQTFEYGNDWVLYI